ncbi:MAG: hypothetical protein IJ418_11750 [Clostridia bacterium]|nr:hypothetical protein [Clostridia bacterium]
MKRHRKWMLPTLSLVLAVVALIVYTLMREKRTTLMYVQVMAAALVPFIVPAIWAVQWIFTPDLKAGIW